MGRNEVKVDFGYVQESLMKTMRKVLEALRNDFERDILSQDIHCMLNEVSALSRLRPDDVHWQDALRQVIICCGMVMGAPPKDSSSRWKKFNASLVDIPPCGHHGLLQALEAFFHFLKVEALLWEPCIYDEKVFLSFETELT